MGALERLLNSLCPTVFKAAEDPNSEIYKVFSAVAHSFDLYKDQIDELMLAVNPYFSSGDFLTRLSQGFGWERFSGEMGTSYKKRFKAFLAMPKCGAEYILDIVQFYTVSRPSLVEGPEFYFTVYLPAGATPNPNYVFSIGGPPDWGCGIGDDGLDFAGAVYASMTPGVSESLTYLQYILDQIKPAGTVAIIASE